MTLLEMVNNIANDMDSENVNSVTDTVESEQIAQIIRTSYFDIISHREWPHLTRLVTLTPVGNTQPTHMTCSDDIQHVHWVKYNIRELTGTRDEWREMTYLTPSTFIDLVLLRDSSQSNVVTVVHDTNINLYILSDVPPTWYTSFDDHTIVMDAYDAAGAGITYLEKAKVMCMAYVHPTYSSFTMLDDFTPDLPAKAFPYLLAEAKSACFNALRQVANAKEEQKSRRHRSYLSQEKYRIGDRDFFPDYGRGNARGRGSAVESIATGDRSGPSLPNWWPT
jgi:hypothetical protein